VGSAIKIAKFARDSSFYQLRDTVDRVIEEVRTEFYRVLLNKALIEVELETTELLRQELRDQQNRFEAGTVPRFNVLRAEVELANAQPALISARNNYRIAQYQLMKTLGLAYVPGLTSAPLELVGELPYVPRKVDLSAAVAQALASRPFLAVQRATILSEEQQVRVARGGYLPTVSLVSGYDARNETGARSTSDAQDSWYAGVEGQWRIFDGFETRGKVKQALARLETARINYEDSVRQVELEVQQAVSSLQEAEELIESQRKNVEQATEALRLARERLSAGAGTQLEVLDARVALTRAQVTEVEARYRYNQALANLDRVTASNTVYHASLLGTDGRTVETIKVEKVDKLSK
jgi:outer membrane protein